MNKEIKFRAWDKVKKEWAYFELKSVMFSCWDIDSHPESRYCNFGLYTGLKDKTKWEDLTKEEKFAWISSGQNAFNWNGKEIYKSMEDIIKLLKERS